MAYTHTSAQLPLTAGGSSSGSDLITLLRTLEHGREQVAESLKKYPDEDIAAIKRAIEIEARLRQHTPRQDAYAVTPLALKMSDGLTEAVKKTIEVLEILQNDFSVRDIEDHLLKARFELPKAEPRARIAMILQKLYSDGKIKRTFEGGGSVPHRYKVA